jgi:hypothetical protein
MLTMAETEDSFSATGPTVVAFETLSTNTPVDQSFGVSVVGDQCGVYGQQAFSQRDRRTAPFGAGVFGRGEGYGVYGISHTISETDTPDISRNAGIGIFSVSDRDKPAILGDNFVLESDRLSTPVESVINDATTLPIGVGGVSWHGHGVYAISLNLDPAKLVSPDASVGGVKEIAQGRIEDPTFITTPPSFNDNKPAGVLGLSVQGAGVRGVSRLDRGGIFQSAVIRAPGDRAVAQIRLVPHAVRVDTHVPALPSDGQTGDLLSIVYPDPNNQVKAHLWFCTRGSHVGIGPAEWREVSLGAPVIGS